MSEKALTIFEHLSGITDKKRSWDKLTDADKKSFSVYLINRWLSMNMEFIEIVNEFQKYTIGQLQPAEVYKLYLDFLPKQKQFNKYIKGKKDAKYNSELIELITGYFLCSKQEAREYIDIYLLTNKSELTDIIKKYGKTDSEITKLLKNGTN